MSLPQPGTSSVFHLMVIQSACLCLSQELPVRLCLFESGTTSVSHLMVIQSACLCLSQELPVCPTLVCSWQIQLHGCQVLSFTRSVHHVEMLPFIAKPLKTLYKSVALLYVASVQTTMILLFKSFLSITVKDIVPRGGSQKADLTSLSP
ncbi:hypothetical protein BsWGS_11225 [Bradybaena similaris]